MEGRAQPIGAAMLIEQEHLLPLAPEGFDPASLHCPGVNGSGCAKVLTNLYSAPLPVGTEVAVKVYSAYVGIWHEARCVAQHERCYDRHQKVLELEHYLDVLTKKPGALASSTALEQRRAQGRWTAHRDSAPEQRHRGEERVEPGISLRSVLARAGWWSSALSPG